MNLAPYRRVLAVRDVRTAVVLGIAVRIPVFAGAVLLTLHVVGGLGLSYSQAGLVTMAHTAGLAVSGPWRGRLLDRKGLRPAVLPSLVVLTLCWSVAPFVGYVALLVLATLAGLFSVPVFSIIRQAVIVAAKDGDRRTALSLDSVAVEVSFMIGPLVAVWAATTFPTSWSLFAVQLSGVVAGAAIWLVDPRLKREEEHAATTASVGPRTWLGLGFWSVCLLAATTTIVLTGTDIALVAVLRELRQTPALGPVLSVWGLGSAVGGLIYGGMRRPVPATGLLFGLGAVTLPLAWAHSVPVIAVLAGVAGLLCAPTITATVDQLTQIVPESARGEAIGGHGGFLTGGSALGAPLTGLAIDAGGAGFGFAVIGIGGMAVGVTAALAAAGVRARRTRSRPAPEPAHAVGTLRAPAEIQRE